MDLKKTFLLLIGLLITAALTAQPVTVNRSEVKVTEGDKTFYLHTVAAGQTLFSIARAYEVNQSEIIRYNPAAETLLQLGQVLKIPVVSSTTTPARITTPPAQSDTINKHTVAPGETLFSIARRYGVSVQALKEANPVVTNFDNLSIGTVLRIPQSTPGDDRIEIRVYTVDSVIYHQVQRGESLFGISRSYKVSQDSVIAWNPELADAPLRRGQTLRIVYTKEVHELVQPAAVNEQQSTTNVIAYDTILHQIRDQETIWGLARRYNTTVDEIIALNPELKDGLKNGHFIYIPVARKVTPVTTAPLVKGCEKSRYREKYKVALLIPLYLDEIDRIFITPGSDEQITKPFFRPFSFIEFYQGMLIALDSMKKAGLSVDLHVYDITNDTITLKRVLAQPELQYMDLIIGPFFTGSYEVASRFAIQHNIKLVSPFARNARLLADHGNLFQMNAGSGAKLKELARHIASQYEDPRVIFVMGNSEEHRALANTFRSSLEHHTIARSRKPYYAEVVYATRGLAGVSTQLDATKHNVIVNLITGETMVSNYISNVARLSKNFEITMFGIPEWHEYRTFNLNDLMDINLHLFATAFVDYEAPHTKHFLREYRNRYKGEPEENYYGFMGYDIGMYFLSALHQFGLDFEACLDQLDYRHLGTGFIWQRSHGQGFENTYLNLFRYHGFDIKAVPQR